MTDNVVPMVDRQHRVSIDTVIALLDQERQKMEEEKFSAIKRRSQDLELGAEEALGHMSDIRAINAVFHRMRSRLAQAKAREQQAVEEKSNG